MPDPTPDQVAAYLAEVRERAAATKASVHGYTPRGEALPSGPCGEWVIANIAAGADVPRLLAAVEAVLAVHCPYQTAGGWPSEQVCGNCADAYGEPVDWPCETVQAISAALLEGESGA